MRKYWLVTQEEKDRAYRSALRGTTSVDMMVDIVPAFEERSPLVAVRRVLRAMLPYTWTTLDRRTRCIRERDLEDLTVMLSDPKTEVETPQPHEGKDGEAQS